ncbi:hypothetical protein QR680_006031 [Steinernema hermaphroditum]|uniref:Uncharacterized protein n=1 Tax=Steinernema hermaphroditum TaxID=289476 RepID=A0AA39HU10_9BILA|nr:hypothetical protein QR680_006031 [Steinernema hermaphroditum]
MFNRLFELLLIFLMAMPSNAHRQSVKPTLPAFQGSQEVAEHLEKLLRELKQHLKHHKRVVPPVAVTLSSALGSAFFSTAGATITGLLVKMGAITAISGAAGAAAGVAACKFIEVVVTSPTNIMEAIMELCEDKKTKCIEFIVDKMKHLEFDSTAKSVSLYAASQLDQVLQ